MVFASKQALFPNAEDFETVFTHVIAGIAPKAIGRGEMVALIVQNPLMNVDGTSNPSAIFFGSGSNLIYYMIPGQESPIFYAEDQKDLYIKLDFPAVNPNGEILTLAVSGSARGTGYQVGDILSLPGGTSTATVTVSTVDDSIVTLTISAPGAGYSVNDVLTVDGGDGTATIRVDTIGGGGEVLTFTLLNNGDGYATGVTTTSYGGAGLGCEVNITEVLGAVLTVAITNGGLGYSAGQIIDATGGSGDGVVIVVLTVDTVTPESADITLIIHRRRRGAKQ